MRVIARKTPKSPASLLPHHQPLPTASRRTLLLPAPHSAQPLLVVAHIAAARLVLFCGEFKVEPRINLNPTHPPHFHSL